jgi:hypothetical protein
LTTISRFFKAAFAGRTIEQLALVVLELQHRGASRMIGVQEFRGRRSGAGRRGRSQVVRLRPAVAEGMVGVEEILAIPASRRLTVNERLEQQLVGMIDGLGAKSSKHGPYCTTRPSAMSVFLIKTELSQCLLTIVKLTAAQFLELTVAKPFTHPRHGTKEAIGFVVTLRWE